MLKEHKYRGRHTRGHNSGGYVPVTRTLKCLHEGNGYRDVLQAQFEESSPFNSSHQFKLPGKKT